MTTEGRIAQIADIKRRYEEGHSLDDIQFLLSELSAATARLREAEGHLVEVLKHIPSRPTHITVVKARAFLATLPDAGQENSNG